METTGSGRRYMEPTRSADHYPVPMSAHASRLSPPRFPSSFPGPGPGSSMPSTSPTALCAPSPMGGMKIPRLWQECTESCGRHEKTSMVNENGGRDLEPFQSK